MNKRFSLKGLGVAIITPFNKDKSVDFNSLERLLNHISAGNVDYIVVLGTTGESPTLSSEERVAIADFVASKTTGIPLMLGLGGNNTQSIIDQLSQIEESRYGAILSVVPYYNKPSQEGIYRHYYAIAEASPLPIVLYNVPGRTGTNMTAETTLRLAALPNIIGVKEASGNLDQIAAILATKPNDFEVVSGDDALTCKMMQMGASGVISVLANAYPSEMKSITDCSLSGNFEIANSQLSQFADLLSLLFKDGNPAGIKATLESMEIAPNELRLPLVKATEETTTKIREFIEKFREG